MKLSRPVLANANKIAETSHSNQSVIKTLSTNIKMQFRLITLTALLAMASAAAQVKSGAIEKTGLITAPIEVREPADGLESKRSCTYNGCKCAKGFPQGQYCGWGTVVTNLGSGGDFEDAYECNPSGGCCDYGHRDDCEL